MTERTATGESAAGPSSRQLQATLILACLGQFMVILDVSVVNVALPAIRHGLGFTEQDLQWVVNAYTVTFAGFLLLGGRAADLLGRRRVFVGGLVLFALSSLAGALAQTQWELIAARAVQGLGGAVVAPASLSILTTTFTEPAERNRAVGIWGAMGGVGGACGVLLGGVLTDLAGWRWILLINVPIGLAVAFLTTVYVAEGRAEGASRNFDLAGAVTATMGLSLLVLGIVRTDVTGWGAASTLGLLAAGVGLIAVFLAIEGRFATQPLMPLRIFRSRMLSAANVVVMFVGAASFGMWFFVTLYLQEVLGYTPIQAGLAFLPMTLCIVAGSVLGSRAVLRVGARPLLIAGMLAQAAGLLLFARMPVDGTYLGDVLVPSLLVAIGIPLGFVPATICAVQGVATSEAGLASGLVNTSRLVGGALGLAVLAAIATSKTNAELHLASGVYATHVALTDGFQVAFVVAAGLALAGAAVAAFAMPRVVAGTLAPPAQEPAAAPEPAAVETAV
jgi:EmrB/QacA subfamily drug resistance transporter